MDCSGGLIPCLIILSFDDYNFALYEGKKVVDYSSLLFHARIARSFFDEQREKISHTFELIEIKNVHIQDPVAILISIKGIVRVIQQRVIFLKNLKNLKHQIGGHVNR